MDKGRFECPDLPSSVEDIYVDLKINSPGGADMDQMVVDLKRFALKMAGNPVEARMYLTKPISDPNVDAELKANLDLATDQSRGADERPGPSRQLHRRCAHERRDERCGSAALREVHRRWKDSVSCFGMKTRGEYHSRIPWTSTASTSISARASLFAHELRWCGGSSSIQAKGRMDNYLQWWLRDSTLTGSLILPRTSST